MAFPNIAERISVTTAPKLGAQDRTFLSRAFLLAIGIRVGLFIVAYYVAGRVILGLYDPLPDLLHQTMNRWDAIHYLRIAEIGYPSEGDLRILLVFFPLYPLTVRIAHYIIPNYVLAGVAVSFVASIVAGYYLQKLSALDNDDEEAGRALSYFFLFPSAYFLIAPYTEALFLALVLSSFYAARRGHWAWAGTIGMLACATRLGGLALIPALALEAWQRDRWQSPQRAFWLALIPVGFLSYLVLNWVVTDDPFAFMTLQSQHPWYHESVMPWEWLADLFRGVINVPGSPERTMNFEVPLAAFLFAVALLAVSVRWLRLSYQVYAWVGLLMLMFLTLQWSMPRYIITIFPLFLILARIGRRPAIHQALLAASAMVMAGTFVLFAIEYWGI